SASRDPSLVSSFPTRRSSDLSIDSQEGAWNKSRSYEDMNTGHRPMVKGGYFPVPPVDSLHDLRGAMCLALEEMGLETEVHHHERSEEHTSELQSRENLVCRLL